MIPSMKLGRLYVRCVGFDGMVWIIDVLPQTHGALKLHITRAIYQA